MATTSPRLAAEVLDCLSSEGTRFALLHGEEALLSNATTSDVDIVTETPILEILRDGLSETLATKRIAPLIHWPYDVAGTATVFFVSPDMGEAAQLDALHDPHALGKFGAYSQVLLTRAEPGARWSRTTELDSLLYQLRKSHWKVQPERMAEVSGAIKAFSDADVIGAIERLFEPTVRHRMMRLLDGVDPHRLPRETSPYKVRNFVRRVRRLRKPIGAWISLNGDLAAETARVLHQRGQAFLPTVAQGSAPTGVRRLFWWGLEVAPVTFRPGLFVSVDDEPGWPRPFLEIQASSTSASASISTIVQALSRRALE